MTELYNCKRTQDHETFAITKFDERLVVERSYFVGPNTCQCEAWAKRKTCRHQQIKTLFMMNKAYINSEWFLDFDQRRWRQYPQLLVDGTVGEYIEKLDGLSIGDGGYHTAVVAPKPSTAVPAEGVILSTPAGAPEVEPPTAPSGATPQTFILGGLKRRKGL